MDLGILARMTSQDSSKIFMNHYPLNVQNIWCFIASFISETGRKHVDTCVARIPGMRPISIQPPNITLPITCGFLSRGWHSPWIFMDKASVIYISFLEKMSKSFQFLPIDNCLLDINGFGRRMWVGQNLWNYHIWRNNYPLTSYFRVPRVPGFWPISIWSSWLWV